MCRQVHDDDEDEDDWLSHYIMLHEREKHTPNTHTHTHYVFLSLWGFPFISRQFLFLWVPVLARSGQSPLTEGETLGHLLVISSQSVTAECFGPGRVTFCSHDVWINLLLSGSGSDSGTHKLQNQNLRWTRSQ